mgnify:FL=1
MVASALPPDVLTEWTAQINRFHSGAEETREGYYNYGSMGDPATESEVQVAFEEYVPTLDKWRLGLMREGDEWVNLETMEREELAMLVTEARTAIK